MVMKSEELLTLGRAYKDLSNSELEKAKKVIQLGVESAQHELTIFYNGCDATRPAPAAQEGDLLMAAVAIKKRLLLIQEELQNRERLKELEIERRKAALRKTEEEMISFNPWMELHKAAILKTGIADQWEKEMQERSHEYL